jgi:hypothetical protein
VYRTELDGGPDAKKKAVHMSISSISSNNPGATPFPLLKQSREDFTDLLKALKSGDTEAAQEAFGALKQDVDAIQTKITEKGLTPFFGTRPVDDLQALQSAMESGDVSEAKKAFHTLMQDLRQIRRHQLMLDHRRDQEASGGELTETSTPQCAEGTGGTINVTA